MIITNGKSRAKQVLEKQRSIKSRVIIAIFKETASKKKFLIVQGNFGRIVDIVAKKLCCF